MSDLSAIREAVVNAERAKQTMSRAMAEMHCMSVVGDQDGMERARQEWHDAMDAFADNMWVMHRAGQHG